LRRPAVSRDRHAAVTATETPPHRQRALLVEDEALIALELEDMLAQAGFETTICSTVEQALIVAKTAALDVAVLDVNLNGKLVFPVAHVLCQRKIPFVFLTGYARDLVIPADLRNSVVLKKPFEQRHVISALHREMGPRGNPEEI
jgi:DNA-binding response OmpR family regulator